MCKLQKIMIFHKDKGGSEVSETTLTAGCGLTGDRHEGSDSNQISLLFSQTDGLNDGGEADGNKGKGLCHRRYKANLHIECDDCPKLESGDEISVGEATLVVSKSKPCFDECELHKAGEYCYLVGKAGFAEVRTGGDIKTGDSVNIR